MLSYEILRIIWWLLLGILLAGFAVMDGFDLGVGMLLPLLGRNDIERRVIINTVGPVWEGNQVWIILGAGAIFAAWPAIYAVSFSGFYLAMFLLLTGFILRPVGFKYRSKIENPAWRSFWDWALFAGGFIPALIFGVALGNVLQGVPFYFDDDLRAIYTGTFWQLLNPYAILCGLVCIAMLIMHGGLYLSVKTDKFVQQRAKKAARIAAIATISLFAIAGIWLAWSIPSYHLVNAIAHDGPSNPLYKLVSVHPGGWLQNFHLYPWFTIAPLLGFIGAIAAFIFAGKNQCKTAFVSSGASVLGIVLTVGVTMFPFILPSSSTPNASLLVWDSSSSQLTLFIMLIATLIFLPLILFYTAWVYKVLKGKVTNEDILIDDKGMY